jgi:hypothetical protein
MLSNLPESDPTTSKAMGLPGLDKRPGIWQLPKQNNVKSVRFHNHNYVCHASQTIVARVGVVSFAVHNNFTTMSAGLGIPVKLLHESLGHIVTVELKTGHLYRGKLAEGGSSP